MTPLPSQMPDDPRLLEIMELFEEMEVTGEYEAREKITWKAHKVITELNDEIKNRPASVPSLDYPLDKKGWKEGADITKEWAYLRDECMKYYDMAEDKLNACVDHKEDGYGIARQLQGFLNYCVMHLNAHGLEQPPSDKKLGGDLVIVRCALEGCYDEEGCVHTRLDEETIGTALDVVNDIIKKSNHQADAMPCVSCSKTSDTSTPDDAEMCWQCFGEFNAAAYDEQKETIKALKEALEKYEEAFEDLFTQCLSNGVFDAWGNRVDCINLNEAHRLASIALAERVGK